MIRAVQPHAAQLLPYYGGTDELTSRVDAESRRAHARRIPFTASPSLVLTCIGFIRSMSDGTTKREGETDSEVTSHAKEQLLAD
jgi:hypothetical protein